MRTQWEDSRLWTRKYVFTAHQIYQHLDCGLLAFRTVRHKLLPVCGIFAIAAWTCENTYLICDTQKYHIYVAVVFESLTTLTTFTISEMLNNYNKEDTKCQFGFALVHLLRAGKSCPGQLLCTEVGVAKPCTSQGDFLPALLKSGPLVSLWQWGLSSRN